MNRAGRDDVLLGAPYRKAVEDVCGAKMRRGTARKSCGRCVRCKNAKRHRTEKPWRMCAVLKREEAPHGKFAEDVYGAKTGRGTARKVCGGCVWCENGNRHRTGKLWRMCTVSKAKKDK